MLDRLIAENKDFVSPASSIIGACEAISKLNTVLVKTLSQGVSKLDSSQKDTLSNGIAEAELMIEQIKIIYELKSEVDLKKYIKSLEFKAKVEKAKNEIQSNRL